MKFDLRLIILLPVLLSSACWKQPSQEAKDDAKIIADGMRAARDATNAKGENRLSNNEINQFEGTLAQLGDKDNIKSAKCTVLILEVQNLITEKNMPDFLYKQADDTQALGQRLGSADIIATAEESRARAREAEDSYQRQVDNIVKGSLLDWLLQMGLKSMDAFGAPGNNEAYKELQHECMQKPYETVMNPYEKMKHH